MNKYATNELLYCIGNIVVGKENYCTYRINLMKMIIYFWKLACNKNKLEYRYTILIIIIIVINLWQWLS